MFAYKPLFLLASTAALFSGGVNAFTGRATWDSLGTTPCTPPSGVQCPLTDFRVALPADKFPTNGRCCATVHVSYQGHNIDVTFTDLFLAGAGSNNISLSHQAFALLAPLEEGQIFDVVWNL
ncbi:hypothetical protein CPC08DRAFT_755320 [Agrocybe pediades]|nr:hypothetical protein CPC08DRAFT_755320 [Agrocybe pediades]